MSFRDFFYLLLIAWNLVVLACYGFDKRRAIKGQWRISEKSLLLLSLGLGGIGALLGGQLFHHKINKYYFWLAWLTGLLIDMIVMVMIGRI